MLAGRMGWRLNPKDLFLRFPGCFGSVALRREIYSVSNNSCVTEPEDRLDFCRCKKIIENSNKHKPPWQPSKIKINPSCRAFGALSDCIKRRKRYFHSIIFGWFYSSIQGCSVITNQLNEDQRDSNFMMKHSVIHFMIAHHCLEQNCTF